MPRLRCSGRNRHGVDRLGRRAITVRAERVEIAIGVAQIKDAPPVQTPATFARLAIADNESCSTEIVRRRPARCPGDDRGLPDVCKTGRIAEPDDAGLMGQDLAKPVWFILRVERGSCHRRCLAPGFQATWQTGRSRRIADRGDPSPRGCMYPATA